MKFILIILFALNVYAPAFGSAFRYPSESYEAAVQRNFPSNLPLPRVGDGTIYGNQTGLKGQDFSTVPEWAEAKLTAAFLLVRDHRYLYEDSMPSFQRRVPWLYAADGCWARADQVKEILEKNNFPKIKKLFIFGTLSAKSPYGWGSVNWWYHVAPVARIGNTIYVIDPAVNPAAPVTLEEWITLIGTDTTWASVSLCSADAYAPDPGAPCDVQTTNASLSSDTKIYLNSEWSFIKSIPLDPKLILGTAPPWLKK